MAKTLKMQISSNGSSVNYNNAGQVSGNSTDMGFRVTDGESNSQIGDANFSFRLNLYNTDGEYEAAVEALKSKIDAAIKAFEEAVKK